MVRSDSMKNVSKPAEVQLTKAKLSISVPIAYSYFWIPLNVSLKPLQVAVRLLVLLVQSISVPVPSNTVPAMGPPVSTITPSEVMVVDSFSALSVAFTLI